MAKVFLSKLFLNPLQRMVNDSRSVGVILFLCSALSIIIANTSAGAGYTALWTGSLPSPSTVHLPHSILHWLNDGLMAAFFFLVGMEIKRELLIGELSSIKKSLLPLSAAIGGMLAPAAIYLLFNKATGFQHGWGIPMATDIAFSLGVASMLGKRVPTALKTFLMALAIIDDLGAILVIALFYGNAVQWLYLLAGMAIFVVLLLFPRFNIRFGWWNFILALLLWYCFFNSGIHATIAGVLFAITIPLKNIEKLERGFHTPVNFIILPLFALANTAIILPAGFAASLNSSLGYGIAGGLIIGKPAGILAACWILIKLNWGELPRGVSWMQLTGIGLLAGIGFTMSIFIAMLAFADTATQDIAKSVVLIASVIAMIAGYLWLYFLPQKTKG
ncbi:MAG: Na+/H+ antiporter NhaA [Chitinophagaceae bacterium]|nr:Na+/H+ antiporter NhaA [Chitinophagaceae bacterium]